MHVYARHSPKTSELCGLRRAGMATMDRNSPEQLEEESVFCHSFPQFEARDPLPCQKVAEHVFVQHWRNKQLRESMQPTQVQPAHMHGSLCCSGTHRIFLFSFPWQRDGQKHWHRSRLPGLPMCASRDLTRLIRLVREPCGGRRAVQIIQAGGVQGQPILTVVCLIWRQVVPGIALHE